MRNCRDVLIFLQVAFVTFQIATAAPIGAASEVPASPFVIKDDNGDLVPLFSKEAYRAEFRHLQTEVRKIDLKGRPVETDGWTHHIPEAEWPFMMFAYFAYASANIAQSDAGWRNEALAEMRWLIEAIQTPRMSGFVTAHFGEPFAAGKINPAVFVHGHFLNMAMRYREVSGDAHFDPVIHRVASALHMAFQKDDQAILKSYRDMWWISDNLPAHSALSRYDRLFHRGYSVVNERLAKSIQENYTDSRTGLLATYVDASARRIIQGPRGISTMYGLHFLRDFNPQMSSNQFRLAQRHLIRTGLGFAAVREFPDGVAGRPDVDSGPLIGSLGPSASGFAIAACALNGDEQTAWQLVRASVLVCQPEYANHRLRYAAIPSVGQAVILFGKTSLMMPRPTVAMGQK